MRAAAHRNMRNGVRGGRAAAELAPVVQAGGSVRRLLGHPPDIRQRERLQSGQTGYHAGTDALYWKLKLKKLKKTKFCSHSL